MKRRRDMDQTVLRALKVPVMRAVFCPPRPIPIALHGDYTDSVGQDDTDLQYLAWPVGTHATSKHAGTGSALNPPPAVPPTSSCPTPAICIL